MYGEVQDTADGKVLIFERRYDRPVEKVWAALTVPERIADWFADAEIEPRVGGRYVLRFPHAPGAMMTATITRFEPPRLFEHSWKEGADKPQSRVRWILEPHGDGCRMTLEHIFSEGEELADFASGWHAHLEALELALGGTSSAFDWERWRVLKKDYEARLA